MQGILLMTNLEYQRTNEKRYRIQEGVGIGSKEVTYKV